MRRLEHTRIVRSLPGRARNNAETAMYLAHVVRERHRLEQERQSLEKRIRRIEARLTTIVGEETKLALPLHTGGKTPPSAVRAVQAARPRVPAFEVGEVTLQY